MTLEELIAGTRFTLFLGRNGSGKSTHLRTLDSKPQLNTKYISPERGGTLKYDPNVDQNISNNVDWLANTRRANRFDQFRQQSAAQFRNLEVLVLREIEQDVEIRSNHEIKFDSTLEKINKLLPNINLRRADKGFEITSIDDQPISEEEISSGEAELIALCIEVLVFARSETANKILLLDEPDVHLHPDLQQKLIDFVKASANEFNFKVVIATHSTAIIGAFGSNADLRIAPVLTKDQSDFQYFEYDPICHEILPIFGAHPLSSQFNKSPALLLEGEDDKRVFDQIVRSGNGDFCFSACVVGTVNQLNQWETWLSNYLPVIYDDPKGFSLRDLDDAPDAAIEDLGCVTRMRLSCYAIENLLLTDECFDVCGLTSEGFLQRIIKWKAENPDHQAADEISALIEHFDDRRILNIKQTRNVLVAVLEVAKPWEVLVGQVIAGRIRVPNDSPNSIHRYLGEKVVVSLFPT